MTPRQRRIQRLRQMQLRRRLVRRGVCPCGDIRIEDPGPHLATCRWILSVMDGYPY